MAIIITVITLSMVVPYFGSVLWLWGLSIIIYTYRSAKIGRKKAPFFAEACSQFNGHVFDVVSNIQAVIYHAPLNKETTLLNKNISKLETTEQTRNRHAARVMLV